MFFCRNVDGYLLPWIRSCRAASASALRTAWSPEFFATILACSSVRFDGFTAAAARASSLFAMLSPPFGAIVVDGWTKRAERTGLLTLRSHLCAPSVCAWGAARPARSLVKLRTITTPYRGCLSVVAKIHQIHCSSLGSSPGATTTSRGWRKRLLNNGTLSLSTVKIQQRGREKLTRYFLVGFSQPQSAHQL
jgi:hypothetical protein